MSSFSVVILHHNKAAYSEACLYSLLKTATRPLEIINVDNGSHDETPRLLDEWEEAAAEAGIETQRLTFETNIGAVRGRNEAIEVAGGDYIAFLDNDTVIFQPDWLNQSVRFLEENPQCGIVVPKLLFPWEPFAIECCGAAVSPSGRIQYLHRGEPAGSVSEPFEIQCAISAAWVMRTELVETIGLLDEAFSPVQYEDMDFCYRARQRGYQVWAHPGIAAFHFEHTTTAGSEDINFRYVTTKNGLLFKKRWESTFRRENGTTEEATKWLTLPKHTIEEVDWRSLAERGPAGSGVEL
jgi:GT2 family glycosyltransferase